MAEASISTEEDIVNIALARIGARGITTLASDTAREAAAARVLYPNIRDNLLRSHTWNFAIRRAQLSDSGSDPTFGWEEGYTLPSDFLRVVDVLATDSLSDRIPYQLEAQALGTASTTTQVLLCDSATCFLIYVYKEDAPSRWTEGFQDAVAWQLAAELSRTLKGSNREYDMLQTKADRALSNAKSVDGIENYPESFPEGSWVSSRRPAVDQWGW